jgi:hypothetical protein
MEHVFSRNSLERKSKMSALRDACWKFGAGGFALLVVPSFDLVIYKMAATTGIPQPEPSHERDDWKPILGTPFQEGSRAGDDFICRVLEMVCAAVRD